mmetsp:Transcript_70152/g.195177  ORF Transcript_70152/g.195177 Transcript_70152/m.195177 type:complete len:232 (-) Transcript_70152:393-1088(-)
MPCRPRSKTTRLSPHHATKSRATPRGAASTVPGTRSFAPPLLLAGRSAASKPWQTRATTAVDPSINDFFAAARSHIVSVSSKASTIAREINATSSCSDNAATPWRSRFKSLRYSASTVAGKACAMKFAHSLPRWPSNTPQRKPSSFRSLAAILSSLFSLAPLSVSRPTLKPTCPCTGRTSRQTMSPEPPSLRMSATEAAAPVASLTGRKLTRVPWKRPPGCGGTWVPLTAP